MGLFIKVMRGAFMDGRLVVATTVNYSVNAKVVRIDLRLQSEVGDWIVAGSIVGVNI
jgi:hypothetical protein